MNYNDGLENTSINWDIFWKNPNRRDAFKKKGYIFCGTNCPGCARITAEKAKSSKLDEDEHSVEEESDWEETVWRDGEPEPRRTITATRMSDGVLKLVMIKALTSKSEIRNMMTLHRHRHRYSPANHCTPLLTLFRDIEDPEIVFAVMPFLRTTPKDMFQYVSDVAEFVGQVLLGIGHMHSRHIAHRDCSFHNILTDIGVEHLQYLHQQEVANDSLEKSIPLNHDYDSEFCEAPSPNTIATTTKKRKYFIHDTTFSQHGDPEMLRISQGSGVFSRDLQAPEYREYRQSYNPFDLDIFLVGNMLRNEFLNKYSNLEFLRDLVAMMTHEVPRLRPKASECLAE